MKKLCEQCGQKNCGFVNRGMEEDCDKVQWYQQGYDDAVDNTCEWLEDNYPYYFDTDIEEQFKKAMEQ